MTHFRYEILRMVRNRPFYGISLGLPLVLFYAIASGQRHVIFDGTSFPLYFMTAMAVYGSRDRRSAAVCVGLAAGGAHRLGPRAPGLHRDRVRGRGRQRTAGARTGRVGRRRPARRRAGGVRLRHGHGDAAAQADYRDVPWTIGEGWFELDEPALRARLTSAQLVLGPVSETVPDWLHSDHAPIAFAAFDLDYYSATLDAFAVFEAPEERLLPRVVCYFDASSDSAGATSPASAPRLRTSTPSTHSGRSGRSTGFGTTSPSRSGRLRGTSRCTSPICSSTPTTPSGWWRSGRRGWTLTGCRPKPDAGVRAGGGDPDSGSLERAGADS